jgi:hypothetical protein
MGEEEEKDRKTVLFEDDVLLQRGFPALHCKRSIAEHGAYYSEAFIRRISHTQVACQMGKLEASTHTSGSSTEAHCILYQICISKINSQKHAIAHKHHATNTTSLANTSSQSSPKSANTMLPCF